MFSNYLISFYTTRSLLAIMSPFKSSAAPPAPEVAPCVTTQLEPLPPSGGAGMYFEVAPGKLIFVEGVLHEYGTKAYSDFVDTLREEYAHLLH